MGRKGSSEAQDLEARFKALLKVKGLFRLQLSSPPGGGSRPQELV